MVIYLLLLGGMALLFIKLPTSFLPQEDRGIFTVQVQLPAGSTLQQTSKVVEKVEQYFLTEEKQDVVSVFAIIGSGPGGNGQNVARLFVRLKDRGSAHLGRQQFVRHHRSRHAGIQQD